MATLLPACQLPDGADPCEAYIDLQAKNERLKEAMQQIIRQTQIGAVRAIARNALDQT
jgi:hypothetical protein